MTKRFTSLLVSLLCIVCAVASTTITINSKDYNVDTLSHKKVGPGTWYTALKIGNTGETYKLRVFFMTIDNTNEYLKYNVEFGRDSILGGEAVSRVAARHDSEKNRYFCGINGDFYNTAAPYVGTPINACISRGEVGTMPISYPVVSVSGNKDIYLSPVSFTGAMLKTNSSQLAINYINGGRGENQLILYNGKQGHYTRTNAYGYELKVVLADGESWTTNADVKVKVVEASAAGNMKYEPGEAVLSGHGTAATFLRNINIGDELSVNLGFKIDNYNITPQINQIVGGNTIILSNSVTMPQGDTARHPRTAVGTSSDKSKTVFCVVDGRSSISSGSTYYETGDIMRFAGCADAINLDGGGSSTCYIRTLGVQNVTSDGSERAVSNCMFAVSTAPDDNNLAEISCTDYVMHLPKSGVYTPTFYGFNQYGILIDTNVSDVVLTCDASIGEIRDGKFHATAIGFGRIYASKNGITTMIPVTVEDSQDMHIRLSNVIVNGIDPYTIEVQAMVNGELMNVSPEALSWSVEDESIATVSSKGVVMGVTEGVTNVIGKIGDYEGVLQVSVEVPNARIMPYGKNADEYTITSLGVTDVSAENNANGVNINLTYSSSRTPYVTLTPTANIYSIPKALQFRVNPGNLLISSILVELKSADGTRKSFSSDALLQNQENTVSFPISELVTDVNDMINYPITLNYIKFYINKTSEAGTYSLQVPGIEVEYDKFVVSVDDMKMLNDLVVFPNPAKVGENNLYFAMNEAGNVNIAIYSATSGAMVSSYNMGMMNAGKVLIPTETLIQGAYIVKVQCNNKTLTAKLIMK